MRITAAALFLFASVVLAAPKRIVLVSDGNPTQGDVWQALRRLQAEGVRAPSETQARTLTEALQYHVERQPDRLTVFMYEEQKEFPLSYRALWDGAMGYAAGLVQRGLQRGQMVAIMLPTCKEYLYSFYGVLLAGGVPVPLYPPARLTTIEDHMTRHVGILKSAGATIMITVPEAKALAYLLRSQVDSIAAGVEQARQAAQKAARDLADHFGTLRAIRASTESALAAADRGELEELIRSTGFYRNKAKAIQNCCSDLVARHGGDEFVIVLEGLESDSGPDRVAQKILDDVIQALAAEQSLLLLSPPGVGKSDVVSQAAAEAIAAGWRRVRPGDALDFWRVEAVEPDHLIRLRAEMKVPGRAWLQFHVHPQTPGRSLLSQTAYFAPKGVWGLIYWYSLYPIHKVIFAGMIRGEFNF